VLDLGGDRNDFDDLGPMWVVYDFGDLASIWGLIAVISMIWG
jgi:hypothetical protein